MLEDIKSRTTTLQGDDGAGGKKKELLQIEAKYQERFWEAESKHKVKLAGGLKGFMGSKEAFKNKVLDESTSNESDLCPLADLETRAEKIFAVRKIAPEKLITTIQPENLLLLEHAPILAKRVIGKKDVDIAAMIKKLGNNDWVFQGVSYYKVNGDVCPFCQQKTNEDFAQSLAEYFDESFEKDNVAIKTLIADYSTESKHIQQQIQAIIDLRSEFIDNESLEKEKNRIDALIVTNVQKLDQKKNEASQVIELHSLHSTLNAVVAIISSANEKINTHNAIVSNLENEKKTLMGQIWKFITNELKNEIADYHQEQNNLNNAIKNLEKQLLEKKEKKKEKDKELQELEKQIVSIQPTIDGINKVLTSFGFKNFYLTKGDDGNTYKLVRTDGTDAQDTLSEGERNFVTFLYFYHLLKGSHTESGTTADKIVVFDDPVSSLDSDVLFIVSSLIRELIEGVRHDKKATIKQIFILTHNIHFHKEVSFDQSRNENGLRNDESFWLVKKQGNVSTLEKQSSNPIKTAYQLLWDEVRSEKRNKATIQNTLRRILEYYFKLLGGISLDTLYNNFDGDDKTKCKALCSWVNDGSHSVFDDDHYTTLDDSSVERYLQVFKQIFDKSKHIAHYNMMMGISAESEHVATKEASNNVEKLHVSHTLPAS